MLVPDADWGEAYREHQRGNLMRGMTYIALCLALIGCGEEPVEEVSRMTPNEIPDLRWSHLPQGDAWTKATLDAISSHGQALTQLVPRDAETWCPGYEAQSTQGRAAFWAGLLSTLSKHESTWNQRAAGGGGKWFGLVQIAPATAAGYGCDARSAEALKNGEANLSCAVRIIAHTAVRDGVVSEGWRGVAADWGPFHSESKRNDMIEWSRAQPYCQ